MTVENPITQTLPLKPSEALHQTDELSAHRPECRLSFALPSIRAEFDPRELRGARMKDRNIVSLTFPTKVVGTLCVPSAIARFAEEFGERHMECAYYFDFCRTRLV